MPYVAILLIGLLVLVVLLQYLYSRNFTRTGIWYSLLIAYLLAVMAAGVFWYQVYENQPTPEHRKFGKSESEFTLFGTIVESTRTQRGNPRITLRVDSLLAEGYPTWKSGFTIEAYGRDSTQMGKLAFGNEVAVIAELDTLRAPRNPNQFDYREFLKSRGIYLTASINRIIESRPVENRLDWVYWQVRARMLIGEIFSSGQEDLARAVILGDRSGLEREAQTAFSRAGLAHLMAVSGMHVGFLMVPVWFLIPFFWRFKYGALAAFTVSVIILIFYAGITGFSVSVMRASLMASFLVYARSFQRQSDGLNLLGAAALIMLIINPQSLFDVGFQLSFGAVLIILTTLPASRAILPDRWRYTKSAVVYQFVMVSVLVQGGLFPILVYYFNEFSVIGPVSNTISVPFVQAMFTLSMINLGLASFSPGLASVLNTPSDWIVWAMGSWVDFISDQSFAWISGNLPGVWFFLLWAAVIAVFASMHHPELRWKFLNVLLIVVVIVSAHNLWQKWHPSPLKITAFDVGQADALLIQVPDGTNFFYDTGLKSFFHDSGEQILAPELRARGIDHLDAIIHSHPHSDHIGGTEYILNNFTVDKIYQPEFAYDTQVYLNMMKAAEHSEVPVINIERGDVIDLSPELRLFVLAPHSRLMGNDPNTWSAVVKMYYGENSILLTGDATSQTETYMVQDFGEFLQSDLLKVGHHGSRTSSTTEFLKYVDPKKSVASLERESRFGHPHPEAARNLMKSGTILRYTSLQGAVKYKSDGEELWHEPWR